MWHRQVFCPADSGRLYGCPVCVRPQDSFHLGAAPRCRQPLCHRAFGCRARAAVHARRGASCQSVGHPCGKSLAACSVAHAAAAGADECRGGIQDRGVWPDRLAPLCRHVQHLVLLRLHISRPLGQTSPQRCGSVVCGHIPCHLDTPVGQLCQYLQHDDEAQPQDYAREGGIQGFPGQPSRVQQGLRGSHDVTATRDTLEDRVPRHTG